MSEKVELKKEYVRLKQLGKEKEASKILRQIWAFPNKVKEESEEPIKPKKVSTKKKFSKPSLNHKSKKKSLGTSKFSNMDDLSKIKGIGKETVKDLSLIYPSLDELIKKIKDKERLPIRNDIESKLKKEFL